MTGKTADTAEAQAATRPEGKPARAMREARTLVLKKSKVTVVYDAAYNAADAMAAQRAAGRDASRFALYLIQRIALFDGRQWAAQEIEEKLAGMDWLTLQAAVLGDDAEGDEGASGNG